MDPSFPQNQWAPLHTFQKSMGSVEPTEPTLTTPLFQKRYPKIALYVHIQLVKFRKVSYSSSFALIWERAFWYG